MKNWNITGKIKAVVLGLFSLPLLFAPIGANPPQGFLSSLLMPLLFGSFMIPVVVKVSSSIFKFEVLKPQWNDNPFKLKRPLIFFQFVAFFYLSIGSSIIIGSALSYQFLNLFGLTSISMGAGILTGIHLLLKWEKPKAI
jgi:hypothetical protein